MKKRYNRGTEEHREEIAKIIVTIIPFILIIVILAVTLIVSSAKKKNNEPEDIQKEIMDYADSNQESISKKEPEEQPATVKTSEPISETEPTASPIASPSATPYKEVMEITKDYSKVKFNKDEQLKEMMNYWADSNQKALDDLAKLDRFIAMSYQLRGTKDCYYYGATDGNGKASGMGIAVYADNQYYYGNWKNGVREGKGTWVHYHIHNDPQNKDLYLYHQYTGGWVGDLPEGEGSEHYDYNESVLIDGVNYNNNLIGSYSKGLYHGKFYITSIYQDGSEKEWNATATNGSWDYLSKTKDKAGNRTVQVEIKNEDNYIWIAPKDNVNLGVKCLISKNKN